VPAFDDPHGELLEPDDGKPEQRVVRTSQRDPVEGELLTDGEPARPVRLDSERQGFTITQSSWTGITPSPEDCERLEKLAPGFTKRVLDEVDREGSHRRRTETTGQWMGYSIALVFFAGALVCILTGHQWAGGVIGTFDIVALVSLFLFRRDNDPESDTTEE